MKANPPLAVAAAVLILASIMCAQVQTETSSANAGPSTKQVTVERGEVVMVQGNDLFVKAEDGTIRHFPNVPESARITVDGQQLGIHDLKPGMKLERTITTTTTPKVVTTVQSVTGKVWHVTPPTSVILTLDDGTNQQFKIPKGQKFNVDGQMVDAWGLKKGMKISAQRVVEVPQTVVDQQRKVTGSMPAPAPAPAADTPVLVAEEKPMAPPSAAAAAPAPEQKALPKTGSVLPLVGMTGLLLITLSLGLRWLRS
jgi:hypothetical protein